MPCGTLRGPPSFRSLAAPCSIPRTSPFACRAHPSEDARSRIPASSGPTGTIEAGESSASRRSPHFGARPAFSRGVDSSSAKSPTPTASGIPVASSFPLARARVFIEHRALVRRPPRPVPRGPRERRALLRPRMPSIGSRCAQRARAEARTNPRSFLRDDGVHVMRIAAPRKNTLRLPDGNPGRLHARESPPVRLPFTRSWSPAWLSTIPA